MSVQAVGRVQTTLGRTLPCRRAPGCTHGTASHLMQPWPGPQRRANSRLRDSAAQAGGGRRVAATLVMLSTLQAADPRVARAIAQGQPLGHGFGLCVLPAPAEQSIAPHDEALDVFRGPAAEGAAVSGNIDACTPIALRSLRILRILAPAQGLRAAVARASACDAVRFSTRRPVRRQPGRTGSHAFAEPGRGRQDAWMHAIRRIRSIRTHLGQRSGWGEPQQVSQQFGHHAGGHVAPCSGASARTISFSISTRRCAISSSSAASRSCLLRVGPSRRMWAARSLRFGRPDSHAYSR